MSNVLSVWYSIFVWTRFMCKVCPCNSLSHAMFRQCDILCRSVSLSSSQETLKCLLFVAADIESIITHRGGDDLQSSSNCLQVTSASQDGAVMILLGSWKLCFYLCTSSLPWLNGSQCHHERSQGGYLYLQTYDRDTDIIIIIHHPEENCGFLWGFFHFSSRAGWRKQCEFEDVTNWTGAGGRGKMPARSPIPPSGSSNTHLSLFNFHLENNLETTIVCVYFFIKFKWSMGAW